MLRNRDFFDLIILLRMARKTIVSKTQQEPTLAE